MGRFKVIFILVFIVLILSPIEEVQAQRRNSKFAFERRVYQRWNRFRPWWWFKIIYRKYDDEDRRNILQLAPIMVSTTITKDYTENQKLNTDTIFRQNVNTAMDKVLQKRWILFDEARVLQKYEHINMLMAELMENGMSVEELMRIEDIFFMMREKIEIVQDSYIGDAEKSDAVNTYMKDLDDFINVLRYINLIVEIPEEEIEP